MTERDDLTDPPTNLPSTPRKVIVASLIGIFSGGFDSKVIQPGTSWKYVARKKGEFPYTCSFHPMNGKLTVR